MSEEDIIKNINKTLEIINSRAFYEYVGDGSIYMTAITDLLELYKKEKEKNKELEEIIDEHRKTNKVAEEKIDNILKVFESKSNLNNYISKDKIKDFVSEKMKNLYVDSCAEDSGKYTAYKNILNLLEEK